MGAEVPFLFEVATRELKNYGIYKRKKGEDSRNKVKEKKKRKMKRIFTQTSIILFWCRQVATQNRVWLTIWR